MSRKAKRYLQQSRDLHLIRSSGLLDEVWYLKKNPDVANAQVNPVLHYLQYGAYEGRDPSPNFSSRWYLDTYEDVKKNGINPFVHYLRYGKKEGRTTQPRPIEVINSPHKCPVCQKQVDQFLPLSTYFTENLKKYGFPFTADETETINVEHYSCPHCGASDRDRLYACYLEKRLTLCDGWEQILLLDIAPSLPLTNFIDKYKKITHHTADLLMADVDRVIDITNMPEIDSNSYDILICSHVLEHVNDDKKALSELYRVLKPGGWGIIMVPINLTIDQIDEDPSVTDVGERWRRFAQDDHVRLYNKSGFIERVEAAGFTLKQFGIDYFGKLAFEEYGISNASVLYIGEK